MFWNKMLETSSFIKRILNIIYQQSKLLWPSCVFVSFFQVTPQPVYINDPDSTIKDTIDLEDNEDVEEDLETPTGENSFYEAKVGLAPSIEY